MNRTLAHVALAATALAAFPAHAHLETQAAALDQMAQGAVATDAVAATATLDLRIVDAATDTPIKASFRLTDLADNKRWWPQDWTTAPELRRADDWWTIGGETSLRLAPGRYRLEAIAGLESKLATREIVVEAGTNRAAIAVEDFTDPRGDNWWAGNTHLHMQSVSRDFAQRYLEIVPEADGLDILYVSYLERLGDDAQYVTNTMGPTVLAQIDGGRTAFDYGQETRHNFGPFDEGYGHALFLPLAEPLPPVSVGPSLTGDAYDVPALAPLIVEARARGASVIWAHNDFGTEDIASWIAGLVDAQNLFDGGERTHYSRSVYRYWDIGLHAPLSSGTDWFMLDFARVYVNADTRPDSDAFLAALGAGRSFITNGPLLDLSVAGHGPGDTIALEETDGALSVRFRAQGRSDFKRVELVYNGAVVAMAEANASDGAFLAEGVAAIPADAAGWIALRTPWENGKNLLGEAIRAHTSPVYLEKDGKRRFDPWVARGLISEMEMAKRRILSLGRFENDADRDAVMAIYDAAIDTLEGRIAAQANEGTQR